MHSENLFKAPRCYFFSSFIKAGTKTTYGLKPIFMANLSAEIMQLVVTFSRVEIYSSLPDKYVQCLSKKNSVFFGHLCSKIGLLQIEIKFLKRPAGILIFRLQTNMNQIFWMKYYEALQTKGLQSYKPSKFTKIGDGPRASSSRAIVPESDLTPLLMAM